MFLAGQRNTVQRQLILDAIRCGGQHPAIDEIYTAIHQSHPTISKTTIYRNLRKLADEGLIHRITLQDGLERYDENAVPHYHFNCKCCGALSDLDMPYLYDLNETAAEHTGLSIDRHDTLFSGLCPDCAQTNTK